MLHCTRRRSGVVIVLVALCLTAMLGIVAIALDGGLLLDDRRRIQAAADAAALAAAIDLYKNFPSNKGLDPNGTARASALSIANLNGYNNNGTTNTVTVSIPPGAGNYAGKAGYAEVNIQYNQQRAFSAIFGSATLPVSARAVAGGLLKPLNTGIIVLDPTSQGALNTVGNATIDITSGPVIVDSSNAAGATFKGNASITAPTLDLSGSPGYSVTNGNVQLNTTILSSQPAVPDPLQYLQPPPTGPLQSSSTLSISGKQNVTLNAGLYIGGISIQGQANVTMNPGIYYMQGGGSRPPDRET